MFRKPTTPTIVLLLLCLMYFITYVDRVNVGTAANAIKTEFQLSNTELGLVLSGFAYPYALFQIFGGWIGDRFGPRRTLFVCGTIWAVSTMLTGLATGLLSLFIFRLALGFGEGATFPTATRAMQSWVADGRRSFAQGLTHSFARLGNAITPPVVAALIAALNWRGAFIALGLCSLLWVIVWGWYFRDSPAEHKGVTAADLARLPTSDGASGHKRKAPWARLARRIMPVSVTYFCYAWTLWLYLNWLPSFFLQAHGLDLKQSALFASGVFFAGVVGDTLGGTLSDMILRRTGKVKLARLSMILSGLGGGAICLLAVFLSDDPGVVALLLSAGFFFLELTIAPMWSIPMDIAPQYSGTASGLMNTGSAMAAIISPLAFGYVVDVTGNWILPFAGSVILLLVGIGSAFLMHPERPFLDLPNR
ncbi:MFS transporter [Telmatospirillum siberiense]|uniref:MFS transporter n=1 Tax=Telmatospirillum siberiense TaxID=382514 RepID=A0A2N3PZ87_9PROT|nr:MFS transporter [Telmatospirillum siberiense]PKU25726.1 MFS transporter [Telmatospirillum siberiense]